ncbi:MAG: SMP-30/gluconolactonase/LRE family protein [Pseudomonadota bacterium]
MKIERIGTVRCQVGEGPLWDVDEQALYFIDLLDRRVWRYDAAAQTFKNWPVPSMIGAMALRRDGGAIVALQDGVHALDLDSGVTSALATPPGLDASVQLNDGKVDPAGRFVFGSQARSLSETRPLGALYGMAPDGAVSRLDDMAFTITNGPCWSPDGGTFYFSDSLPKIIYAYDYDVATGAVFNRRKFADTSVYGGIPDGATVDADGRIWVTVCGGGKIVAYLPDGGVDRVIDVPTPFVTSVMFGGVNLDELYFTSIDASVLGMGLPQDADGGGLFVIKGLGVRGLPERRFAG